jgi:hypothetical protein
MYCIFKFIVSTNRKGISQLTNKKRGSLLQNHSFAITITYTMYRKPMKLSVNKKCAYFLILVMHLKVPHILEGCVQENSSSSFMPVFVYQTVCYLLVTNVALYRDGIFKLLEPRNRFQGIGSAGLCSLAGRYGNPIPTWFLATIDCSKFPAQLLDLADWQITDPCGSNATRLLAGLNNRNMRQNPARNLWGMS